MSKNFPSYSAQRKVGDRGVTFVRTIIEDQLGWIFRPSHLEDDFGLDGYIDIITDDNSVTGKYLGVQIKTGASYFKSETALGWKFSGENKHLNYFLNSGFPIVIIIVNLELQKAYWELFDIGRTDKSKTGWSITISRDNVLDFSAKNTFLSLVGQVIDYMSQIEYQWELNERIKDSSLTLLSVSREEIEALETRWFIELLEKLTINDEMVKRTKGKISFLIDGYNDDDREIYEIPEIRDWIKKVVPEFKYWGYFLNMEPYLERLAGLRMIHLCSIDLYKSETHKKINKKYVEYDPKQTVDLMTNLFVWLNEFTDKYKIPLEVNKEQSYLICVILWGEELANKMFQRI
ncbi:MAG: DUF4365 domain-containing protein [Dyadobacter fermentans]